MERRNSMKESVWSVATLWLVMLFVCPVSAVTAKTSLVLTTAEMAEIRGGGCSDSCNALAPGNDCANNGTVVKCPFFCVRGQACDTGCVSDTNWKACSGTGAGCEQLTMPCPYGTLNDWCEKFLLGCGCVSGIMITESCGTKPYCI